MVSGEREMRLPLNNRKHRLPVAKGSWVSIEREDEADLFGPQPLEALGAPAFWSPCLWTPDLLLNRVG